MEPQNLIEEYYSKAVEGLTESVIEDEFLWYTYVISLPTPYQVVYTISILHQQVFNGGFHQYFFNSFGQFAYLTLDFLNLINAREVADILNKVLVEVNYEMDSIDTFRFKVFNRKLDAINNFDDSLCNILDELDQEYYKVSENLKELLIDYLITQK